MITHHIRKGFDLRIAGAAESRLEELPEPDRVAVHPPTFPGIKPKLVVAEGDEVTTGQPLFFDKGDRAVQFVSPATGRVAAVELGARRFPQRIVIERAGGERFHQGTVVTPGELMSTAREDLVAALKGSGLWPLLRQRPLGKIAKNALVPAAIYVNGMDTEPLAADPAFAVRKEDRDDLQLALRLLGRLTDGSVYLTVRPGELPPAFKGLEGVEVHAFAGPHPAGLVGTHVHEIQPLGEGQTAWYLKAQEAVLLGRWLRTGCYPAHRVVACAGSRMPARRYVKVREGAALALLTGGQPLGDDVRVINGTVLNGVATESGGDLTFYSCTVTAIPEGEGKRDMFGWALPQTGKHSASRSVWSWLKPRKEYDLDTRLNGGPRAIVNIGQMESVMALDIHPTFLMRAIRANDLDEALGLGLLEVTEEDVALCTFVDPSKHDIGAIVREGLDLYEREG